MARNAPVRTQADIGPGRVLNGRYELTKQLGVGGMAFVWLAHDRVLQQAIAIKFLHPAIEASQEVLDTITREARVALRLSHPNIVRLLNVELSPFPHLLLEYVEGHTLQSTILSRGRTGVPLSNSAIGVVALAALIRGIADALDYAHSQGVIHRDVKPDNIIITGAPGSQVAKLMDFGIAATLRASQTHLSRPGASGTQLYMAPEQLEGQRIDHRVDVYGLGVTTYHALCGELPFKNEHQVFSAAPADIPGVGTEINRVLARAIARSVQDRYARASEFAAELTLRAGELASGGGATAETSLLQGRGSTLGSARSAGFRFWTTVTGTVLLLMAALIVRGPHAPFQSTSTVQDGGPTSDSTAGPQPSPSASLNHDGPTTDVASIGPSHLVVRLPKGNEPLWSSGALMSSATSAFARENFLYRMPLRVFLALMAKPEMLNVELIPRDLPSAVLARPIGVTLRRVTKGEALSLVLNLFHLRLERFNDTTYFIVAASGVGGDRARSATGTGSPTDVQTAVTVVETPSASFSTTTPTSTTGDRESRVYRSFH